MKLAAEQADAIGHATGDLQLIACAGPGETEVVAQHILRLLTPQLLYYQDDVDLQEELARSKHFYNVSRPHVAIGGKEPYEALREKL